MLTPGRSYLMKGGVAESLLNQLPVIPVDRIVTDADQLDVKDLRAIIVQALSRPLGDQRLLLIKNAERLSEIMQNTLLKILEEPPAYLIVILQTKTSDNFLPTVRSRLHPLTGETAVIEVPAPLTSNPKQLESQLRALDRQELISCFRQELYYQASQLELASNQSFGQGIELLEKSISRLQQNCNQKLVVDSFILHWSESSGIG